MKTFPIGLAMAFGICMPALAQTSVSVYGVIDAGIVLERGGPKGAANKLESGISNGSRLGFRGSEDLGGGTSAIFTMENGFLADTGGFDQGGLLFGRQMFIGLQGQKGTLKMGRQYTPIYTTLTTVDPFANNYGGAAGQVMAGERAGVRMNNTVLYESPTVSGFNGQIAYGFGEVAGSTANSRQIGGAFGYEQGRLLLRAAFNQTNNATATDRARNSLYIAKYDFGPVTATAGIGINKGTGSIDSRDYIVSATMPLGVHTLMATFIRKDDRSPANSQDVNQVALAYTYALSKRTNLYAAFAHLNNISVTTTKFGTGNRELDLGVRHAF